MKKITAILASALLFSSIYAETAFTGKTGIAAKFVNQKSRSFDPSMNLDGFFAGQMNFGTNFLVRGEFSVQTGDIYDDFFSETESIFRFDELSATYIMPFYGVTHFFSLFLGTFEPIGNQSFLQHNLGVESFSSPLTENYLNLNGCNVYDFYGYGGAYSFRFNSLPISSGILIYKNNKNEDEASQLNGDFRLGTAFKYLTSDSTIGISAPMNTVNAQGEDVVLLIDTIYLHAGIDALIGERDGSGLFLQAGFENLPIRSPNQESKISVRDFYFLFEPRLYVEPCWFYFSFYNIPEEKCKKTLLLDDMLGFNMTFISNKFSFKNLSMEAGLHYTFSFEDKDMKDFGDDDFMDSSSIKISPFAKIDCLKGELNLLLQFNVTKFADSKPESLKFTAGYKRTL